MLLDERGKRVRGFCSECGAYVYYQAAVLCRECRNLKKATDAANNIEITRQNTLASKRAWHHNAKGYY